MSIEVLFTAQIASLILYIGSLFYLYRVLVSQKDATIELLREKNSYLKEQLETARQAAPDALAKSLSERVTMLTGELSRLRQDKSADNAKVQEKELELSNAQNQLVELKRVLLQAQKVAEEFFCPSCKAPMSVREYQSELVEFGGRDVDVDHEYVEFECGLTLADGKEKSPCRRKGKSRSSSDASQPPNEPSMGRGLPTE